jgi:hypothetical protein
MLITILKRTIFIVLLFIYIYGPPFAFLPFSADKLVHVLFLISLFFFGKRYAQLFKYPIISLSVLLQSLLTVYTLILYVFNPTEYNYILQNFLLLTEVLISSLFFVALYLEWIYPETHKPFEFFLLCIIVITSIQAAISFAGILDPKFNTYVNNVLLFYQKNYNLGINFRGIGMSDDYFFTMPIVQGFGVVSCLYLSFQGKYQYLVIIPFLLLSISFNARIGFTPVVIFVVLSLLFLFRKSDFSTRSIILVFFLIGLFSIYFNPSDFWKTKLDKGLNFGYSFFNATINFLFSNNYENTANYSILMEMVFFPDKGKLLFGTGENIFFSNQRNSDIGYINQLFYGGIVYLVMQFTVVFVVFYQAVKSLKYQSENKNIRIFLIVTMLTFLIANIKGYFFLVKPGLRLAFLIFYIVYFLSVILRNNDKPVSS